MVGLCVCFGGAAESLLGNGYSPLPILAGTKRPAVPKWQQYCRRRPSRKLVSKWVEEHSQAGIGIATGKVVAIDVDIDCAETAGRFKRLLISILDNADLLIRVGRAPRFLVLVRAKTPLRSRSYRDGNGNGIDILASGRQFVAFGIHPETRQPYRWEGESPQDVPVERLPLITDRHLDLILNAAEFVMPSLRKAATESLGPSSKSSPIVRDENDLIIDGRDTAIMEAVVFAADEALRSGEVLTAELIADRAWSWCEINVDRIRPKGSGRGKWSYEDVLQKADYALKRIESGRLVLRSQMQAIGRRRSLGPSKGGKWTKERKDAYRALAQADRSLSDSAYAVHIALLEDLNRDGGDYAAPSIKRLMKQTRYGERRIYDALAELTADGYWMKPEKADIHAKARRFKSAVRIPGSRARALVAATDGNSS